jgi:hypothetical protein
MTTGIVKLTIKAVACLNVDCRIGDPNEASPKLPTDEFGGFNFVSETTS